MSVPRDYWVDDMQETWAFLQKQVGCDLPVVIKDEVVEQMQRVAQLPYCVNNIEAKVEGETAK